MRHKKNFNHLGRTSAHRKAMLSNMASSLIMHKRIETTTAKAKALQRYVEPMITRSKEDSTHSRRVVFSYLQDKDAVTELFREIGAKVGDRPGGYTRIIKLGNRLGDNADMCIIELVDYNETLLSEKSTAKKTTSRRRRGAKSQAKDQSESKNTEVTAATKEEVTAATKEEVTEAEVDVAEVVAEEPAVTDEAKKEESDATAKDEKKES